MKIKVLNFERWDIVATHCNNKHDTCTISAIQGSEIKSFERWKGGLVEKPVLVKTTSTWMMQISVIKYLNYYSVMISRKSFKWWKIVFFGLIELCVVNAMIFIKILIYLPLAELTNIAEKCQLINQHKCCQMQKNLPW